MRAALPFACFSLGLVFVAGCAEGGNGLDKINGSVDVQAGAHVGNVSTVNGSVQIGNDASVSDAETVNGGIDMGPHAKANSLETVNGEITLQTGAEVAHSTSSVNGSLQLATGSRVGGKLGNVNGKIVLDHAIVDGGIETTSGDITVGAGSTVHGGLHVEKHHGLMWVSNSRKPRIVIGPTAVVDGTLRFDREVDLLVSPTAKIGPVSGAKPIPYSGQ